MTLSTINPNIQIDDDLEEDVILCSSKTAFKLVKLFTDYQEMEENK